MLSVRRFFHHLTTITSQTPRAFTSTISRPFSTHGGSGDDDAWTKGIGAGAKDDLGFDVDSPWSTGLTKEHFDGEAVGNRSNPSPSVGEGSAGNELQSGFGRGDEWDEQLKEFDKENNWAKAFMDGWETRLEETKVLLKQGRQPGARGAYLKDSEKAEMYRLHKEDPKVYTVEKLAKDYRIMRQRVHAILWLKEDEEEEEKKLGRPLDDSIERLLDSCPDFFKSHDREFHVASLRYKPEFKVMPEGWDGTTRDPDEVHYEISKKEDEILYQDFVLRMNFNKKKIEGQVKCHKYSRRRPAGGWNFTVEKMGPKGKRGVGGGWKFVSLPDGSSRPLNDMEKLHLQRETPRRRRKIFPC